MAEAFLHREQHIGVAARLDMDQPIGVKARKMQGRGEEIAPAQAPEDGALGSGENAGEEDRRARIVGKFRAARDLVERARSQPAAGQPRVERIEFERDDVMTRGHAFDSRNFGAKIGEDGGLAHGIIRSGNGG